MNLSFDTTYKPCLRGFKIGVNTVKFWSNAKIACVSSQRGFARQSVTNCHALSRLHDKMP